ncbi:PPIC-type PPIASE domain protein [gut metagenome]|uniref:PPIC-type PPIASE domain protein n=1 Tax=gut metagenome TaxID=749906 RepID=J9CMF0_9ZZZZ
MKNLVFLFLLACSVGWVKAQQHALWLSVEADPVLNKELNTMCQRELSFKLAEAKRLGLDTLPMFRDCLEMYRKQLAYKHWMPSERSETISQEPRVKIRQVLFSLPQNLSMYRVQQAQLRMDSLAAALAHGMLFEDCVKRFSDEKQDRWIGRLEVSAELEEVAFGLQPGEVSKPFFTPEGICLVKVLDRRVFPVDRQKQACEKTRQKWVDELKTNYQFTAYASAMNQWLSSGKAVGNLFSLRGRVYTAVELKRFANSYPAGRLKQLDAFIQKSVLDLAYATMEEDDPSVSSALQEYGDSLLVREVCKRKLEAEGLCNEDALQTYFAMHQAKYQWKTPHYHAVVIHATNKRVAKQVRKFFKNLSPNEWKEAVRLIFDAQKQSEVLVEEGVFASGDNIYVDDVFFKRKRALPIVSHPITKVVGKEMKGPLDYREVRAEVWRDLLADFEKRWMDESKYSMVEIHQEVLKTVKSHRCN